MTMANMESSDSFLRPPAPDINNNNKNNNKDDDNEIYTNNNNEFDQELQELDNNNFYAQTSTETYVHKQINNTDSTSSSAGTMVLTLDDDDAADHNNNNNMDTTTIPANEQRIIAEYFEKLEQTETTTWDDLPEPAQQILSQYIAAETTIMQPETPFQIINSKRTPTSDKAKTITQTSVSTKKAYHNPYSKPSTNPFSALADKDDEVTGTPTTTTDTTDPQIVTQPETLKFYIPPKPKPQKPGLRPNTKNSQYPNREGFIFGGRGRGRGGRGGGLTRTATNSSSDSNTTIQSNNTHATINTINSTSTNSKEESTTVVNNNRTTTGNDTTINDDPNTPTPIKRRDAENLNVFSLHINVRPHKGQSLPEQNIVINHLLQALQSSDTTIKLLSIPNNTQQRISVRSLFHKDTNELISHHQRFTETIQLNPRGVLSGNVWFTGALRYSSVKKSQQYRQQLTSKYYIFVTLNNIGAKIPIDIGFFIHKLYRHDTVENKQYLHSLLPANSPPFQPEQTIIWAGPRDNRRSASVIKISTRQQDTDSMIKLFEERFQDQNQMTFVRQSYFNCLTPVEKLQFVESQNAFINQHRTYMLRGLKNIDLPTYHHKSYTAMLTIREWLYTLKTNTNQCLILDIQIPIDNSVEITFKTVNFDTVKQWERDCIAHIAREVDPKYYPEVFAVQEDFDLLMTFTSPWEPPIPQQINFLVEKKNAWTEKPKTATTKTPEPSPKPTSPTKHKPTTPTVGKAQVPPKNITTSDDNNTITTITDYQDQILELQEISKQQAHRLTAQQLRLDHIDQQYQELQNIEQFQERLTIMEASYKNSSKELNNFNKEITGINKTNTFISSQVQLQQQEIEAQQAQILEYDLQLRILRNASNETRHTIESNAHHNTLFNAMHAKQRTKTQFLHDELRKQQIQITKLTNIINTTQTDNTPPTHSISRKRHKQRTPNTSLDENQMNEDDNSTNAPESDIDNENTYDAQQDEPIERELSFFDTDSTDGSQPAPDPESGNAHTNRIVAPHKATAADANIATDLDSISSGEHT
jgi:hypothetical protein